MDVNRQSQSIYWSLFAIVASCGLFCAVQAADRTIVQAARVGDLQDVNALIAAGADVNLQARDGATSLLWATYQSHADMVTALIAAGADPNVGNNFGVTPLLQASRIGDVPVMRALLDGGAAIVVDESPFEPVLHAAARAGNVEAVS
jgi:ankyrin repeat protein